MMKNGITLLALLTVGILAATLWSLRTEDSGTASAGENGSLLPNLADRVNEVGSLRLVRGDQSVTIELRDVGWGITERSHYPAEFETVKSTIVQLSELTIVEPKTAKPEFYEKLGLGDPAAADATATLVELHDKAGAPIASVVISKPTLKGQKQQLYARRTEAPQTYACTSAGRLTLDADPMRWITREVMRVDEARIEWTQIDHADGEVFRVEREAPGAAKFLIQDIPAGKKESYTGIANSVATALTYLRLEDVRRVEEIDFEANAAAKATFRCYDGLQVVVETAQIDEEVWAKITTTFEAPPFDATADESEEAAALRLAGNEDVAKESRKYQRNLSAWAYRMPAAKAQTLTKRQVDFLVDEEPPAPVPLVPDDETAPEPEAAPETSDDESDEG